MAVFQGDFFVILRFFKPIELSYAAERNAASTAVSDSFPFKPF